MFGYQKSMIRCPFWRSRRNVVERLKANIAAGTIYISQKGRFFSSHLKLPAWVRSAWVEVSLGEVSLGEKHFTGLKLRRLEKIAG
jgi:hypothetical protein